MRLPHFVKTSCGTPSRELFRSGLPPEASQTRRVVGAAGFEPTLTESESGVLPLNYAPMRALLYIILANLQSKYFLVFLCAFRIIFFESTGMWLRAVRKPTQKQHKFFMLRCRDDIRRGFAPFIVSEPRSGRGAVSYKTG